jgi:short-subunit dehydrogenase
MITGASSGIGAAYAERFAGRGHDLVLVARDTKRLEALAQRLRAETGVRIDIISADLTNPTDLGAVEERLSTDAGIGVLVNNAGAAAHGGFAEANPEEIDQMIRLNIVSLTRLTNAVVPRFLARGEGKIVNIGSVVGLVPELPLGIYGATKAYVLHMSQALQAELGSRGLYVQAVLPSATRTEIWQRSGRDVDSIPGVMDVGELVDAAMAGFDRREPVTIPPLHNQALWDDFETARKTMAPHFRQAHAAARYRV